MIDDLGSRLDAQVADAVDSRRRKARLLDVIAVAEAIRDRHLPALVA